MTETDYTRMSKTELGGDSGLIELARHAVVLTSLVISLSLLSAAPAEKCGFAFAFDQLDEKGTKKVHVYRSKLEEGGGSAAPLAFVSDLKVNTDGTRISYKVDDPRAVDGAINNIMNAMRKGKTIADFERVAKNNWEPIDVTWQVLSSSVIEKDTRLHRTGKPCVDTNGYLVSKTADVSVAGAAARDGDCDQNKWLDALTIPGLVLPLNSKFQKNDVLTRNFVVVMTLGVPRRTVYGIVSDLGPADELGEASVEMNRMLNGLPAGDIPKNYVDAKRRFGGPKSVVLVFPAKSNRLVYPVTPERIQKQVKTRFDEWGGEERLAACLTEIPETH